ncbi:hypothetical protein [Profundibacterium mesophilum]|uniref:Uncharacterized protein n=1 Tax=Profundibacterium mesophilum KAUST100406-0324 TaxID=1037889 RepID=A0A921TEC6_9RHOB|nr:hypothetical protein [Profundibacterium mesophilum]KAF0677172.1 hypothetical protein PMES_00488 [Profundibacterium mesophilum KAUST100406-0324]
MRILLRLATLCLSLALLGGVLMHDLAGARMSLDMASAATAPDVEQGELCPACSEDMAEVPLCDMDCTAPVHVSGKAQQLSPLTLRTTALGQSGDDRLVGLDPGSDPFPPRNSVLA